MPYVRFRLRRLVESLWFRAATLALIVADVVIVVVDLCQGGRNRGLMTADLAITCYFVAEVALRIAALTQAVFFSAWYNVVDFAVVLSTFVLAVAAQVTRESVHSTSRRVCSLYKHTSCATHKQYKLLYCLPVTQVTTFPTFFFLLL